MHFSGKDFFIKSKFRDKKPKVVPAFSIQSLQKNTVVEDPPRCDPFAINPVKKTYFEMYFEGGNIPITNANEIISIKDASKKEDKSLQWSVKLSDLDYCYYFPIMIDGLTDSNEINRLIAQTAATEMIMKCPNKVLPAVPYTIIPIKKGMNTRIPEIIVTILKMIQTMVKNVPCLGKALIPYFRQILPVCNLFKQSNVNLLEGIDENRDTRLADVIEDTLQVLESCGGREAYLNIRYIIPTYESCVSN